MDRPAEWTLLHDLELAARHVLRRRHNPIARAELRRACERAEAFRKHEAAEHQLHASAPADPRPEPPPAANPRPPTPESPPAARLPYRDD